ncbi:MAG TPA: divalent-cation tolerance protein CutA [Bryobacteraceae bacterium]|jgi:periplasmic divalent cation tolerance protein|nr:divalent-cation tolerance protein CutA [Bryobacteraceae bacterium]
MPDFVVVFCTCPDRAEALRLAHAILEQRLAACVNILPGIESVYRWNEKVETGSEVLLLIKTAAERFDALRQAILNLHSYQTPEVIALPIVTGSEPYLAWLRSSL